MKDFDFDELDRAVNSVLATKTNKPTEDPDNNQSANVEVTQAPDESEREEAVSVTTTKSVDDEQPSSQADDTSSDNGATDDTPVLTAFEPEVPPLEEPSEHGSDNDDDHLADTESSEDETAEEPYKTDLPAEHNGADSHGDSSEDDDQTPETEETSEPEASTGSTEDLSTIPVKRGRFMDVMTPHSDMNDAKKPNVPSRSGITITPSASFEAEGDAEKELSEQLPTITSYTPVEESDDGKNDNSAKQSIVEAESEPSTDPTALQPNSESEEPAEETEDHDDAESVEKSDAFGGDTPFIPDVPVEKRPLNAMTASDSNEAEDSASKDESDATASPDDNSNSTPEIMSPVTASAPKEFNEEIMAVEANETIATASDNSAPAVATTTDAHPLFDTSSLATNAHEHHATSKMTWVIILGSLFLVGAALGVLYFLYGQA